MPVAPFLKIKLIDLHFILHNIRVVQIHGNAFLRFKESEHEIFSNS